LRILTEQEAEPGCPAYALYSAGDSHRLSGVSAEVCRTGPDRARFEDRPTCRSDTVVPELEACPNCGNTDVYCHANHLDVVKGAIENYCNACDTTFDLEEAVYG